MGTKYHAKRTWSELCGGRWFDSKAEARRGEELRMLEMAGEIAELNYQMEFVLCDKPKITITVDFSYIVDREFRDTGILVKNIKYEETKGVLTRDFRTKLAWLKEKYDIDVLLTK